MPNCLQKGASEQLCLFITTQKWVELDQAKTKWAKMIHYDI